MISLNSSGVLWWNPDTWHISGTDPTDLTMTGIPQHFGQAHCYSDTRVTQSLYYLKTTRKLRRKGNRSSRQAETCPLPTAHCYAITTKAWGSPGPDHKAPHCNPAQPAAKALDLLPVGIRWKEKGSKGRQRALPFLRSTWRSRLYPCQLQQSYKVSYNMFSPVRIWTKSSKCHRIVCCYNLYVLHHCFSLPTQFHFSYQRRGFHQWASENHPGFLWNLLAFQILMTSWQFSQSQCAKLCSPLQRPALSIFCGCQLPSASLPVSGSLG